MGMWPEKKFVIKVFDEDGKEVSSRCCRLYVGDAHQENRYQWFKRAGEESLRETLHSFGQFKDYHSWYRSGDKRFKM